MVISIATLGAFPVFPSLSERPEKFRLLVAHLINLKIYECDFVITFFFLIQMNFGLIVNLDLKRALFSQEVRKVQKIASINQPFKTIPQYLALCQTKPSLPCYNHCMLHYVIDYVKFHQLSFSVSVKFYLDFYLFFLLLKQSIQQGCFFCFCL